MLFILDSRQRVLGILSNDIPKACPYYNDIHTESLTNNLSTFEFELPSNHPSASLVEVEGFVIYTDLDNKKHMFIIKEVYDSHDTAMVKKVYCEHTAVGDLLGNIVRPIQMPSKTLEQALLVVLNNTGWEVGELSYAGVRDISIDSHMTSLEALHMVVDAFDGEMEYEVIFDGATVTKRLIHVVTKRGQKTNKVFEYGKDITNVERTENTRDLVTALIGVGKGDANGNPITFSNYQPPKDEDYPKENDYIYSVEAFQRYHKNGKHIFGVFKDEKATNAVELYNNTKTKLKELSKPKLTYNCSMATLERLTGYDHKAVRLGDEIVVKDWSFSPALILSARVVEVKRSKTDPSSDSVVLGDYIPIQITKSDVISKLQNIVFNSETQWTESAKKAQDALDTATTAKEVAEEAQQTGLNLSDTVGDIADKTTDLNIIGTVITSEDFQAIINDKANTDDLDGLATGDELESVQDSILNYVDGRFDGEGGVNESINAMASELELTKESFTAKFQSSGGINLIKNSIGFADKELWTIKGTVNAIQNPELEQLGYGSGFNSSKENGYLEQTVYTNSNGTYSLSFWVNKTEDTGVDANVGVEIWEGNTKTVFIGKPTGQLTTGYELGTHTFTTAYSEIKIRLVFGSGATGTITGLMLNVGDVPLQWQHHPSEIYNTNIQMNMNGIKVINKATKGYTIMSPTEFSGYAETLDEDNQPQMTKIFTLNGDTTEVTKIDIDKEINMKPIKIMPIISANYTGVAFIASE